MDCSLGTITSHMCEELIWALKNLMNRFHLSKLAPCMLQKHVEATISFSLTSNCTQAACIYLSGGTIHVCVFYDSMIQYIGDKWVLLWHLASLSTAIMAALWTHTCTNKGNMETCKHRESTPIMWHCYKSYEEIQHTYHISPFFFFFFFLSCSGTGKTVTGAYLAYFFNKMNKKLPPMGKGQPQVLYCGPSNKSVDVIAGKVWCLKKERKK